MSAHIRIGIYTAHLVHNFGAQLQAYATVRFLQQIALNCQFELVSVVTSHPKPNLRLLIKSMMPQYVIRTIRFNRFHELMPHSRTLSPHQLFENPIDYDLHITGSDQIWNVSTGMRKYPVYFLPFVQNKPKIALASSFGVAQLPENVKPDVEKHLSCFNSLSVREADGVSILKKMGLEAKQLLDPTFWIDRKDWSKMAGDKPIIKGDYIAAYGFEVSNSTPQSLIDSVSDIYGSPVVGIDAAQRFRYDKKYNSGGPKEFLNVIKFAKVVITGSFHGTALSIIFRKDFYVLAHSIRNSRMESLLEQFGLINRMLSNEQDFNKIGMKTDYSTTDSRICDAQSDTRKYIKHILSLYTKQ